MTQQDTQKAAVNIAQPQTSIPLNLPGGIPVVNPQSRVTVSSVSQDDTVIDDYTKGLVLKDDNAHYWRLTVTSSGATVTTDLGTTRP